VEATEFANSHYWHKSWAQNSMEALCVLGISCWSTALPLHSAICCLELLRRHAQQICA